MTTRVRIMNENDSNPEQELVVLAHSTNNDGMHTLKPGTSAEFWVSSTSHVQIIERPTGR